MTVTITEIGDILDELAPLHLKEEWDNCGLLVGNGQMECSGILLGLDASTTLLEEALECGCNTLVVHHPVIFQPLKKIDTGSVEGRLLQKALANDVAILCWHTNFDSAAAGVSDHLGKMLGLKERTPLLPIKNEPKAGLGCIGSYPEGMEGSFFIERLLDILQLPGVLTAGTIPHAIHKVALCGGSGSDFAQIARSRGADLYLSAEIKHNIALWSVENNFCVIDGTHYATEKPAVALLAKLLSQRLAAVKPSLRVILGKTEQAPFVFTSRRG